ncbi:hypothetical protein ADK74_22195 [Streptomyces decoyicus]|nr:hypothetical protein ADK74_22195 [Streptomyces decoyicus]
MTSCLPVRRARGAAGGTRKAGAQSAEAGGKGAARRHSADGISYRYDPGGSEHMVLVPERVASDEGPQVEHWPSAPSKPIGQGARLDGRQAQGKRRHGSPELGSDAAAQLGYPAITRRRALAAAQDEQRRRSLQPYLQDVAEALTEAGVAEADGVEVRQAGDPLRAVP